MVWKLRLDHRKHTKRMELNKKEEKFNNNVKEWMKIGVRGEVGREEKIVEVCEQRKFSEECFSES